MAGDRPGYVRRVNRGDESLAIALLVEREHGEEGHVYIAEQIGRLALEDDEAGVDRWREIAAAYYSLTEPKGPLS